MTATSILAIESGYKLNRAGVYSLECGNLTLRESVVIPATQDPWEWYRYSHSAHPDIVAVPDGPQGHDRRYDWHPRSIMVRKAEEFCRSRNIRLVVSKGPYHVPLPTIARMSGRKDYLRESVFFQVPQIPALKKAREILGLCDKSSGITVYLGEECAVTAHRGDTVVDTSNPVLGEGPFGLTAAGTLPAASFVSYLHSQGAPERDPLASRDQVFQTLKGGAGALAYVGGAFSPDTLRSLSLPEAAGVLKAMAYQVAKEIGRQTVALRGEVSAVVLVGPGTSLDVLTNEIAERAQKWGPPVVLEDTFDLQVLAECAAKIIAGEKGELIGGVTFERT